MIRIVLLAVFMLCGGLPAAWASQEGIPSGVKVMKIWDRAKHSAFTDLIRFEGRFYCTFREGSGHVPGTNGKIRVILSDDGEKWESAALIEEEGIDLRDPKLAELPEGGLMITCGGSDYSDGLIEWHTRVMYSEDGMNWTPPRRVRGIPSNNWFFRITWHEGLGYVAPNVSGADPRTGKVRTDDRTLAIYRTMDGMNYERVSDDLPLPPEACEATIRFKQDNAMVMVIRCSGGQARSGFIATSKPPYREFEIHALEHGMGGPNMLELPDGRWLIGTREYAFERPEGREGTAMVLLIADEEGRFDRALELPSGGDTSYPGMLIMENEVWISYYSSHEGKASIYLARVPLRIFCGK